LVILLVSDRLLKRDGVLDLLISARSSKELEFPATNKAKRGPLRTLAAKRLREG
jgi:hypothetical protein